MNSSIIVAVLIVVLGGGPPQITTAGRRVIGRVNAAESQTIGEPVPGLPSVPRAARGNHVRLTTAVDGNEFIAPIAPDGSFEFQNVPPGSYQVTIVPNISIPPSTLVVGANDILDLQLGVPLIRVSGGVTVTGGGPHPQFQIEFTNSANAAQRTLVQVGATFTADLSAGQYRASIVGLPAGYVVASVRSGNVDLSQQPIVVGASQPTRVEVTLSTATPPPWVKVSGRVTGSDLKGITALRLSSAGSAEVLTTSMKADGSFEFPQVLPGKYEIRPHPSVLSVVTPLSVAAANITNIVIALPDVRNLAGEFVRIEPGEFLMGCSPEDPNCDGNERPLHRVGITKGFEIGKYEVTQSLWETVMGNNPSQFKGADRPVENINDWQTVQEFIEKLNALGDGYRYRLPTEAEWEYAARAGSTTPYPGEIEAIAWHIGNSGNSTHPVGRKQPNAWGLYDTRGNVWEWVQDWYGVSYYGESPALDPQGPATGPLRVLRGGSWSLAPNLVRVSYRGNLRFAGSRDSYGLRLVREPAR
jgi:formylglycine-generating enzyme required for sulfatase activity